MLESVSRLMHDVADAEHREAAQVVRRLLGVYRDHEDLISVGAYRAGTNPAVDRAIALHGELCAFLRQRVDQPSGVAAAKEALVRLARRATSEA